jgi:uncharacterized protein (TIGR03435 family)
MQNHSDRSAVSGSARMARPAGTIQAARATTISTIVAAASVAGSIGISPEYFLIADALATTMCSVMQRLIRNLVLSVVLGGVVAMSSAAQISDQKLAFEVASVKPAAKEELGSEIRTDPVGRLMITNMPLRAMIMYAWQLKRSQISGSKGWIESQGYDIVAKSDRAATDAEIKGMLRALLVERFQLVVHGETAEQTAYLLGAAKPGKVGPGLIEVDSCSELDAARVAPEASKLPPVACGSFLRGRSWMKGTAVALSNVVEALSAILDGTVMDETGLRGRYNLAVEWTPATVLPAAAADSTIAAPVDNTGPTIFTAIQEQLGLRLQAQKRPVEILVIDKATQPDGN